MGARGSGASELMIWTNRRCTYLLVLRVQCCSPSARMSSVRIFIIAGVAEETAAGANAQYYANTGDGNDDYTEKHTLYMFN